MKHILIILSTYIIFGFILSFGGCVKITKVENINQQVRPLNTTIKRIIFHPKFITSPHDSIQLRKHFIDSLTSSLKNLKQYEVILLKSQESLPKLTDNKGGLLVKGHIWSHQSQQRGLNTSIKKLSQRTINYSRSWDVLENKKWEKHSNNFYINLYIIELSSNPKLLRSSFSVSNTEIIKVTGNQGTNTSNVNTQFEFNDLDEESKSFFGDRTSNRQDFGYYRITTDVYSSNLESSLKTLSQQIIKQYFQGI